MKYFTFHRESNDFSDILNDPNVKANVCTKIQWRNYLLVGFKYDADEGAIGFIVLKYGDEMVNLTNKDYTPKPNIDYKPIR